MALSTFDKRRAQNAAYLREFRDTIASWVTIEHFGFVLAALALALAVTGYMNQHNGLWHSLQTVTNILEDFYANVSSELISIVMTVLVLERLNKRRQDAQELTRLKALLGSNENVVTKIAVAELRARGWLYDGSLKDAKLRGANLEASNLLRANLEGADLMVAHLEGTVLQGAHLEGARLWDAHLENVDLRRAHLEGADLGGAHLEGANLWAVHLEGADLANANLEGANLGNVHLEGARLWDTNLEGANLRGAHLEGADLYNAHLEGADLMVAHLEGANLGGAHLEGANLWAVHLEGADLRGAHLEGAYLVSARLKHANMEGVQCDENTILPNGNKWTSGVDWSQFGAVEIEYWEPWQAYRRGHGLISGDS